MVRRTVYGWRCRLFEINWELSILVVSNQDPAYARYFFFFWPMIGISLRRGLAHTYMTLYINLTESFMSILTHPRKPASDAVLTSPQAMPVPRISHSQQQTRTVPSTASSASYSTFASNHRYYPSFYIPDTRIDPAQVIKSTERSQLHHYQLYSVLLPCVSRGRDSSGWIGECRRGRRGSRS